MKETFLSIAILLFSANILSAQTDRVWTEKYNGEEYTIREVKDWYVITNKKYSLAQGNTTVDYSSDGESIYDYRTRRWDLERKADKIAEKVFHTDTLEPIHGYALSVNCLFDSQTKNFTGGMEVYIKKEIKEHFSLQKVKLLEEKLLQAGLNTGRTNLIDPDKKYFILSGGDIISQLDDDGIGRRWTEKYDGEEYTVEEAEHFYIITNKRFRLQKDSITSITQEEEDIFGKNNEAISKIANGVFHLDRIDTHSYRSYAAITCTFDTQTKDYAGGIRCTIMPGYVEQAITVAMFNLLEKRLLESNLNAGKINLEDPSKKYFILRGYDYTTQTIH
jgi:hypothetical protein